jgi:cytoskeletal protein RodZ
MSMPRPVSLLLALVLGASSAGLVACGKENPHLLSSARADRLTQALDNVQAAVSDHDCATATKALARLNDQLTTLPKATDVRLREKLQEGASALADKAAKECQATTETTPTTTTTTPTTTETTTTTTPTTTQTTTTTTPTTTTTTPTTTTPTTTTTTPGNGGATPTTP